MAASSTIPSRCSASVRPSRSKFSVQLEARQIDIDTTHGNLPKLGLTYLWTPRLLTNVSYAHSVGGNLGTELTSCAHRLLRADT